MQKSTFISILAVGLLVSNLLLVGFVMYNKAAHNPEGSHPRQQRHEGPRNIIIERLNFSEEQVVKYDELIQWHRSEIGRTDHKIMELKNELYSTLGNNTDSNTKAAIIASIANTQQEIEQIHYKHFENIRDLCTDRQKPVFDELTKEIASLFAPPHKRRNK
jgi:protein CpxP